ncbi:coiled-coil alpha-helical rod protein 1 isoform X2 [Pygocentrus nattereri]|uniref:coiled-coil alpha-helical rod protein 1 isoform X2 n=1 Tax=Pygocentrus nattereri TaxID=42514 RepID=UPI0018910F33|nr:coiled-coil alpha-helical rod protein 1 isoform X2 [Pygocentrus nattereri]
MSQSPLDMEPEPEPELKLTAPRDFLRAAGVTRRSSPDLLTPSHFILPSAPTPAAPLPVLPLPSAPACSAAGLGRTRAPDPWVIIAQTQQELLELRRENQRLKLQQHRDPHSPDPQSKERERLRGEREELRSEVERLKEELGERERRLSRQRAECDELDAELIRCKEALNHSREKVCEHHSAEISALSQSHTQLQDTLTAATQEVTSLRQRVEEVTSERERLQEQLSTQNSVIAEQTDTLQKLRSYIGTHCGDEEQQQQQQHTLIQKLQKENEALCVSVELLKVRVQAASDILALQERELRDECDPLQKDGAAGRLLSLWREKVFILLVQLQSRDLQLHTEKSQLHDTVCDLQLDVQKLQSQLSVVQHNLRDRTAQLELQNLHTQELQEQLSCAVEENTKLKEQKENRERSFSAITDTAHRVSESVGQCAGQMDAAQCRMDSLAQRLSFATKRLDTVHGLLLRREALRKAHQASRPPDPAASDSRIERLQSEVALLSSERDALTQELKRTPQLIQNALSDLQQQLEKEVGLLTQALSRSRAELDECELRRLEAQRQCEEREETIAELRTEAHRAEQHCEELEGTITELRTEPHRIQQHWQSLMQEKVSEMERVCDKQLREMETLLNTARREHTKAVVALRQVERTAAREREQDREAERTRSELTHTHITQLHTQLKDKDREWNVLLALVQQHGLMSEYRRMRRAALRIPAALQEEEQHKQQQHNKQQEVLSVLGEVRSLSSALIRSSEEEEDEEEEGQGDVTP